MWDLVLLYEARAARATSMHKSESIMQKSAKFCARGSLWVPMAQNPTQTRNVGRHRTGRANAASMPAREASGDEAM